MKHFLVIGALVTSCLVATACASPDDESTRGSSSALTNLTLTCSNLAFTSGYPGQDQPVSTLAYRELTGTQDVWEKYIEFSAGSDASCTFSLPSGTSSSSISALSLVTNYRGPQKQEMLWTFYAWDFTTNAWVTVGDNGFAADWVWTAANIALPSPASRFLSPTGELRIRYKASNNYDASLLDQLVVTADSSGSTTTDPGTSTDAGTTTDPGTTTDAGTTTDPGTTTDAGSTTTDPGTTTGVWQPHPGTSWQWQLTGTLDTSLDVQMYDIDLFDNSASTIAGLKSRGIKVICYLSAGSYENWRPDANQFPSSVLGKNLDGWPGERWLDIRASAVRTIMASRMDLAVQKGCDGIEPDNVDGYTNNTGFPLTAADQLDYNEFLASAAHARNLSVALKNDVDQVSQLVSYFDFALNEECFRYSECNLLQPFIAANKAVFQVEYGSASKASTVCPKANAANFDTLIKDIDLDAWRVACR